MAAGLQVWDSSGNLMLDTSTRVGRALGTANWGNQNGSVTDGNLTQGIPFWFFIPTNGGSSNYQPNSSVSGSTISWTWNNPGSTYTNYGFIVYGVY